MPDGHPVNAVMTAGDLVRALAFSPDGRFLAIGGGDAQAIVVRDLQGGRDQPVLELKGSGICPQERRRSVDDGNRPRLCES